MRLLISPRVLAKLAAKVAPVTRDEICQCFVNRSGVYLLELGEQHETDPPKRWFIAETNFGRRLKICFMQKDRQVTIKSPSEPNAEKVRISRKFGDS